MQELFTLGELYVSDFIRDGEENRAGKHNLQLILTDDGNVRLATTIPVEKMFGKYYYRSGTNFTMKKELKNIVDSIQDVFKLNDGDLWIDQASNDGTLLSFIPSNLVKVGIDPADDSYKIEAEKHADLIIQDFFSAKTFKESKFGHKKAKVITCASMFYDLELPDQFLQHTKEVLDDDSLFVVQLSYTPTMLLGLQFDNILSEHVFYYSFFNIKNLFEANGFKILDCQLNSCNGGSFRIYAMKKEGNEKLFANQPYRDIASIRMNSLLEYEAKLKLDKAETWREFFNQVNELKERTVLFIREMKKSGKRIFAIGASTKGNTLLQYFGLTNDDIDFIVERNSEKVGMKTVGSNIPICSEEFFRKENPDYVLVLIWPFITELLEREREYINGGGHMIVPCPRFEIIGAHEFSNR